MCVANGEGGKGGGIGLRPNSGELAGGLPGRPLTASCRESAARPRGPAEDKSSSAGFEASITGQAPRPKPRAAASTAWALARLSCARIAESMPPALYRDGGKLGGALGGMLSMGKRSSPGGGSSPFFSSSPRCQSNAAAAVEPGGALGGALGGSASAVSAAAL